MVSQAVSTSEGGRDGRDISTLQSEMTHHCDHDDDSVGTQPRQGLAGNLPDGGQEKEDIDQDHHAGDGVETDLDVSISHPPDVL